MISAKGACLRQGLRLYVILAVALCLASIEGNAQNVPGDYELPDGVTVLSEKELHSKIVGNTLEGDDSGITWVEYYAPDGMIIGKWGVDRYLGKWVIEGPVICFDYEGTEYDECNTFSLEGGTWHAYALDGGPAKYSTGEYYEGNPKNLH